jgi:hypothetical protein
MKPRLRSSATEVGKLEGRPVTKGEDEEFLESDLGSDNCGRFYVIFCGYKRGK